MPPPTVDPTDTKALMQELFSDERWAKDQFAAHLSKPILDLCEALAACFGLWSALNDAAGRSKTERAALVAALAYGVLDDLVVSTKLLLTGKLPAAGNVMRQVVEGIAMSMLCSTDELLIVGGKKNKPIHASYWKILWDEDELAQGHRAVDQVAWNAEDLRVSAGGVKQLRDAKSRYDSDSHCGTTTIMYRVRLKEVGVFYLGGEFDEEKLDLYRGELESRVELCRLLPALLEHLIETTTPPEPEGGVPDA